MAWTWRLQDAAGETVSTPLGSDSGFPSRSEAESWIGEAWQELLDAGVEQVTLFDADREVYGPMSLRSE
ncbi:MAG TPA: hypothetical protein VK059_09070 [Nocardioidaceae bacterium]|nr:hypothetical protein [Nocardioidaceae bacterium]